MPKLLVHVLVVLFFIAGPTYKAIKAVIKDPFRGFTD
jgi:hypothetical protein